MTFLELTLYTAGSLVYFYNLLHFVAALLS
mgnify:CR=1 FL=1